MRGETQASLSAGLAVFRRAYDLGLVTTGLICLALIVTFAVDLLTTADLRLPMRALDVACVAALLVWQFDRIGQQRAHERLLASMYEEVERARANFDLALRAGGIGVWHADALLEGRPSILHPDLLAAPVVADEHLLDICGLASDPQLTLRSLLQVVHRDDRERALATLEQALQEGTHGYRDHYRVVRHDGERRSLRVLGSIRLESVPGGTRVWLTGIAKDVTEEETLKANLLEKAEDARRARDAKGRFLAVMSHEVRTPMNGVLGMLDLVIDTPLEPDQRRMLRRCRESAQALLTIVNDILDFSRIEAGKLSLESTSLSLRSLIEDTCGEFALQASRKQLALQAHVDPALPQFVLGDPVRLRQILGNLLGNAIKFTATGQVCVRAEACGSTSWMLEVADTGPGIPPDTMARLFQPFEQADASTTRHFGGTGLGLSIVKQLAELMGGTVECASDLGYGSRFRVVLPLRPWVPTLAAERAGQTDEPADLPPVARRRILLAEDSPINQEVIVRQLARLGHDCDCADDGEQAWSMLQVPGSAYDLLITDADMPHLDGYALTARIRGWEARHVSARLPILAMTANALPGERERCLDAGMDGYVSKPTTLAQLQRALAELFAGDDDVTVDASGEAAGPYADLQRLCAHDPAAVRQVVGTFLSSIGKDAAALDAALQDDAVGELRRLAHRMASGCLQLGEVQAQQALQAIEDAPDAARRQAAWPRAQACLEDALARARAFLEGGTPPA